MVMTMCSMAPEPTFPPPISPSRHGLFHSSSSINSLMIVWWGGSQVIGVLEGAWPFDFFRLLLPSSPFLLYLSLGEGSLRVVLQVSPIVAGKSKQLPDIGDSSGCLFLQWLKSSCFGWVWSTSAVPNFLLEQLTLGWFEFHPTLLQSLENYLQIDDVFIKGLAIDDYVI